MASKVFEAFGTNTPHICTYCTYRHGGYPCSEEEILSSYNTKNCPNFRLGKCFECSVYLGNEGHSNTCPNYVDFEGCPNYKE